MDPTVLNPLVKKRTAVKGRMDRVRAAIRNHATAPLKQLQVPLLLKQVDDLGIEYQEIQREIFEICTTDAETDIQVDLSAKFDKTVIEAKIELMEIQSKFPTPVAAAKQADIRLPRIELPRFDGKLTEWAPFKDLFTATIDKNLSLSGAQKLQYLKSSLNGEALNLIGSFQVTDPNYQEAWTLLNSRYDNEREIVNSIMKRMFQQPEMSKESPSALQSLLDTTMECVRSLDMLKQPVDKWDTVLVYLVVEKMDPVSRSQWARQLTGTSLPTFKELTEFIVRHIRGLQAAGGAENPHQRSTASGSGGVRRQASTHHGVAGDICSFCQKPGHHMKVCKKFSGLEIEERMNAARARAVCFNCLKTGHGSRACKLENQCNKCTNTFKHHPLLHMERTSKGSAGKVTNTAKEVDVDHTLAEKEDTHVLLSTAVVKLMDSSGQPHVCRALLDQGSQASLITEACVKSLGLKRESSNCVIKGISSTHVGAVRGQVEVTLVSTVHSSVSVKVEALIMAKVTGTLPRIKLDRTAWSHIKGLQLADPNFDIPGPIDILLGADMIGLLMRDGLKSGAEHSPIAQNTALGWILSGRVAVPTVVRVQVCEVDETLKKFWELEEIPEVKHMTEDEKMCESHFQETHSRDSTGRFVLEQPLRRPWEDLGSSREQAVSRLKQVERRLLKAPQYREEYNKFMREYLALNHMEPVPVPELSSRAYYLPHHFVLKEDSSTTKFRVVFDGSAKTSSGVSLNQCLTVGPTIQDNLFTLLLRFRCNLIAMKADIGKMYRQFQVNKKECDYQRILWRESPSDPIQEYRLLTLTYGTSSASYLATKCLQQLAEDENKKFPLAAPALKNDFYMDDLMGGESTTERCVDLFKQLCGLTKSAGLELLKWSTSDPDVLKQIPPEMREKSETLSFDTDSALKALGVQWKPSSDSFVFKVVVPEHQRKVTKRIILSEFAKVFDPLGWLSPVTVSAKILVQDIWRLLPLGWDDELPEDIVQKWIQYQKQLPIIRNFKIPRCIIVPNPVSQQFHGFSDASEKAYSAVVYLRSEMSDGSIVVRLVTAKTKVAPIKQISIPRLELCGAVMLAKLVTVVKLSTKIDCNVFLWSDSTIVLSWLNAFPGKWKTFVANRVAKVQELFTIEHWGHVISEENPADCASRGVSASELDNFSLWWEGPWWLKTSTFPSLWREPDLARVLEEEKQKVELISHVCVEPSLLSRFSSLSKLKRVTAYCLRFIFNLKRKAEKRRSGHLTCFELNEAFLHWVCHAQGSEFPDEIKSLKSQRAVPGSSKLAQLFPFLDLRGVLRVGGRLQKSKLSEAQKHQIILPSHHHLTKLIVSHGHLSNLHGGFQLLWSTLQREFWILRARDVIRHHVRKCVTCRKQRAETAQQLMGSLPSARVNPGRPFLHSGVDYAGPFSIKVIKVRSNKTIKAYMCIFVCLSTKAVHLEAVSDMTTEAFLAAFKRFAARRGISSVLYSDQGTNFIGAERELKEMLSSSHHNSQMSHSLSEVGTTWCFNPPSAPHQGGLWEAGVKSAKFHLKRVVGGAVLTFEEFQTVLCQVEACLNSRPLCALSNDPADYNVLTPGHFLVGEPLNSIPEGDLTAIKVNRLSRWQMTQQLVQHFWKRWSLEYLSSLQQRFKWTKKRDDLHVGDLVLVKDDNLPPNKWRMGRIIIVHPGKDSCVRVVTLKTQEGEFQRPVVKLCPILFNDE